MHSNTLYYGYLLVLLASWVASLPRFRQLDLALRVFSVHMGLTFVIECAAFYMAARYHNNMVVYNIFSLVQLVFILLYFNYSIALFRSHRTGYWLILPSVVICVLNTLYLQPLHQLNSYFLVYEGLVIVALSLFGFLQMLLDKKEEALTQNPYFRINFLLIFFWSATFLSWGIYDYVNAVHPDMVYMFNVALIFVNMISCGGIGITYYFLHRNTHFPNGREIPD